MCFSAAASFIASGTLLLIGLFTYRHAHEAYTLLSLFPVLFGIQQGFEGLVWLGVNDVVASGITAVGMYGFLIFAVVLWPGLFASAAYLVEPQQQRKRLDWFMVWLGTVWAVVTGIILAAVPVSVTTPGDHLVYNVVTWSGELRVVSTILYAAIGLVPFFISSVKRLRVFGWLVFVSGGITWAVETQYFVSLWCFWAAAISTYVYFIVTAPPGKA